MQMIYNSDNYCVLEFRDAAGAVGGFEIVDKLAQREAFLNGGMACAFLEKVSELICEEPDDQTVDAWLSRFDGLMHHSLTPH